MKPLSALCWFMSMQKGVASHLQFAIPWLPQFILSFQVVLVTNSPHYIIKRLILGRLRLDANNVPLLLSFHDIIILLKKYMNARIGN
jgi:hypothetical protein